MGAEELKGSIGEAAQEVANISISVGTEECLGARGWNI